MTSIRCVGGIVHNTRGELLLIRRGHAPSRGYWSIPGGRVETGESDQAAVIRELHEETGLSVQPGRLAGTTTRGRYEIHDYLCTVHGGDLRAGGDADDVRWVNAEAFAELERTGAITAGLGATLHAWGTGPEA